MLLFKGIVDLIALTTSTIPEHRQTTKKPLHDVTELARIHFRVHFNSLSE